MLCLSSEASYIFEPFNVNVHPHWPREHFPHWYQYICQENEAEYLDNMSAVLNFRYPLLSQVHELRSVRQAALLSRNWAQSQVNARRRPLPLVKDPLALFSSEWLAHRFGARVVIMIRHPASFVASLKRLDWRFDFSNWAEQPLLMDNLLGQFESTIRQYAADPPDIIRQGILLWQAIYSVVHDFQARHPEWLYVRLEDLDRRPVGGFRELYADLGLRFDERVREGIEQHSAVGNPKEVDSAAFRTIRRDSQANEGLWRSRLTSEEASLIRRSLAEESSWYYEEEDW